MLTAAKTRQVGSLALLTAASSDPVTVAEVKTHSRLDDPVAEGDVYIAALIASATNAVREWTGRALITETWTLTLDTWPGCYSDEWWDGVREGALSMLSSNSVEIRKAPFVSVSKVETVDEDGTLTEFSTSNYFSTRESGFGKLVLRSGQTWPLIVPPVRAIGGIKITFSAGYGSSASDVPAPLLHAIKLLVGHYYENREAVVSAAEMPFSVTRLLQPYKVLR